MREYDLVVQEVSLLVQTDYLTAVAEAWVNRHCPLLAYRSGKQKLREILSENVNRLDVSLFLGLFDNLVGQRWLKQTLISVINGLTDYAHPCQVLADLMTIRERRGPLAGQKLCFVGDGSSMANSLIVGGLLSGMQVTCVCPQSYRPAADVLMFAHKYGSAFHLTADPAEGIQDADVVATAVWNTAKPGTPESEQRLRDFVGYQLTGKLMESAKPDVMVLHCLPAHRGEEISSAVFEQHAPEIFDEAENRLHVQKAVLAILLEGK